MKIDNGHSKIQFSKPTSSSQIKALVYTDIFGYFYTANFGPVTPISHPHGFPTLQ
jgi:hypothetical protein